MTPKTEIYQVRFNKYTTGNGDVAFSSYTLDSPYLVGMAKINPIKIVLIKDRVHVTFEDGGKHVFGYGADTELLYRPVEQKTEETKTDTTE
jgi:hypothetical protein